MRRLHRGIFGCLLFLWAAALIVILIEAGEDEILLFVAAPIPASLLAGLLPYWLVWKAPLREQMLWSALSLLGSALLWGLLLCHDFYAALSLVAMIAAWPLILNTLGYGLLYCCAKRRLRQEVR